MISENTEFVLNQVKPEQFTSWDNLLGFPVENILPEYFYINRVENLVGINKVQIAIVEFEKIMGSFNELLTLKYIPKEVLEELEKQVDTDRPSTFFQRINPLSKFKKLIKNETVAEVDPSQILRVLHSINQVRFEIFAYVVYGMSVHQANRIKELQRADKKRDYENLKTAYKDIINRSDKQTRDAHIKANPNFVYYIPEDGIVINGTTKN